ncbi:hypothetical protein U6A24_14930 [Aquimarina gracilis]|uniref:Uncharacterized protein n=1 Tax=Aquimarina gracilis TaxID=874422 RepID=A0ABU5ZY66_9FLAO|nr:hypothetical protein [Aquimarina gracilis]MEB3346770.1 hypothetical protein [Aquimarina gracilis]
MKSKERHIKLIEGTFSAIEAADVLFSLIANKIKFHNLQMLQIQQGADKTNLHSAKRISELKHEKNIVKDMILKARDEGYELEIYGAIEVKLKKT